MERDILSGRDEKYVFFLGCIVFSYTVQYKKKKKCTVYAIVVVMLFCTVAVICLHQVIRTFWSLESQGLPGVLYTGESMGANIRGPSCTPHTVKPGILTLR